LLSDLMVDTAADVEMQSVQMDVKHSIAEEKKDSPAPVTVVLNGKDMDVQDALMVISEGVGGKRALAKKVETLGAGNETRLQKAVNELRKERVFIEIVVMGFIAGFSYPSPQVARWLGFMLAGYSAIANDSIQTLGTFIASNRDRKWYELWLFVASVFIITSCISWGRYDGDVSYERLVSKGFEETPTEFKYLQVVAPCFLLILTRLRMPVSTTFLLLNCFVTESKTLGKMIIKSLQGYALAFGMAIVIWGALGPFMKRKFAESEQNNFHRLLQWATTAFLWSVWLQQDLANIAVYLPRSLSGTELFGFLAFITTGLAALFRPGRREDPEDSRREVERYGHSPGDRYQFGLRLHPPGVQDEVQDPDVYHLGVHRVDDGPRARLDRPRRW
jgi:hypothetical protein